MKRILLSLFLFSLLVIAACKKEMVPIHVIRFEQDLFDKSAVTKPDHFYKMQEKYGVFYNSYAQDILSISEDESAEAFQPSLSQFIGHPSILQLKHEVDSVFPDVNEIEAGLSEAMTNYKAEFLENRIPSFVTFISEFGFVNVSYDSIIGIGLDMFLGEKYPLYPALEFPTFMIAKLRKEYIVPNTIKALAIGKFEGQLKDKRFLAMMLFEGKVRYFMKQLLPKLSDTLVFGYSQKQLEWAQKNEAMVWVHLVENKMLFNVEPNQYMRYFNDGPFTIATGVPQESAPAIGVFSGYKIIEKYMNENSRVSLKELMLNANWDEILKASNYRPE